jgi:hypothetical protein
MEKDTKNEVLTDEALRGLYDRVLKDTSLKVNKRTRQFLASQAYYEEWFIALSETEIIEEGLDYIKPKKGVFSRICVWLPTIANKTVKLERYTHG